MIRTDEMLESAVNQRSTYGAAIIPPRRRPRPMRPTRPFSSESDALVRAVAA